jgi:hypothetical protein
LCSLSLYQTFASHSLTVDALQHSTTLSPMGCPHRTGFVSNYWLLV